MFDCNKKGNRTLSILVLFICFVIVITLVGCKNSLEIIGKWTLLEDETQSQSSVVEWKIEGFELYFEADGYYKFRYLQEGKSYWSDNTSTGWTKGLFGVITPTEGWIEGKRGTPLGDGRSKYKLKRDIFNGDTMEIYYFDDNKKQNVLQLKLKKAVIF